MFKEVRTELLCCKYAATGMNNSLSLFGIAVRTLHDIDGPWSL